MRAMLIAAAILLLAAPTPAVAEVSLGDLYQPAESIDVETTEILFHARHFTYAFDPAEDAWRVEKRKKPLPPRPRSFGTEIYEDEFRDAEYAFLSTAGENEALLEIQRAQDFDRDILAQLTLYDRHQVAEAWYEAYPDDFGSEGELARELGVSRDCGAGRRHHGRGEGLPARNHCHQLFESRDHGRGRTVDGNLQIHRFPGRAGYRARAV
jgi:hypothetical protein